MRLLLFFFSLRACRFVGPCFCHGANGTDCMGFWGFGLENGIGIWGPAEGGGGERTKRKRGDEYSAGVNGVFLFFALAFPWA